MACRLTSACLALPLLALVPWLLGCANAQPGPGLVLATWNIEHLAARDGAGCRPRAEADYAALRAVADRLDADIIALQEVENDAAVARVFDPSIYDIVVSGRRDSGRGACRGRPGQVRTAQRTGFAINRGRLAALGLRWRRLPELRDLGVAGRRWATRIEVASREGQGAPLELMSLHLKSGCAWGALDGSPPRREQCRLLRQQRGILEEWIDAAAAADRDIVLLGDFNRQLDQRNDDFWRAIDDGEVCQWRPDPVDGRRCIPGTVRRDGDADLVLAHAGEPFPFPYNPKYPYAIDHFVLDADSAEQLVPDSYHVLDYGRVRPPPSDHHPIRIALRLPLAPR